MYPDLVWVPQQMCRSDVANVRTKCPRYTVAMEQISVRNVRRNDGRLLWRKHRPQQLRSLVSTHTNRDQQHTQHNLQNTSYSAREVPCVYPFPRFLALTILSFSPRLKNFSSSLPPVRYRKGNSCVEAEDEREKRKEREENEENRETKKQSEASRNGRTG